MGLLKNLKIYLNFNFIQYQFAFIVKVSNKRILKFNDENLKKQQELIVQSRFSAKKIKSLVQSKKEHPEDLKRENSDTGESKKSKEEEKKWSICTVDIYSQVLV